MTRRQSSPDQIIALRSLAGCEAPLLGVMTIVVIEIAAHDGPISVWFSAVIWTLGNFDEPNVDVD